MISSHLAPGPAATNASRKNIGNLLQAGVTIAALFVLTGGILYLSQAPDTEQSSFSHFHGRSAAPRSLGTIFVRAAHGDAKALIQVGLLVLIATPVARVIIAFAEFTRAQDWIYVVISGTVLALLLLSFCLG